MARGAGKRYTSHPRAQNKLDPQPQLKRFPKADRISQLPDHILIPILSRLSLKEAASSSLLSKRWTSLWKFVTGLNFDANWNHETTWVESTRYKIWVNHVLQLYQGYTLDEFRICVRTPGYINVLDLENWVEFAIRKRVQRLELVLLDPQTISFFDYPIPDKGFTFIKTPGIKSLTNLSLKCGSVTGEIIEHFLSNFPLLECLCVFDSNALTHLHVEGPALRLKVLELSGCSFLQSMEIFAPNLVSFKFNLVQVFASSWFMCEGTAYCFASMLSPLSHIQTLTLGMHMEDQGRVHPSQFPKQFTYLKNLTLRLRITNPDCLFDWISILVERAPALGRLTIQVLPLSWWWTGEYKKMNAPKCKNESLKVVELVGHCESWLHATCILNYLIETAIGLDKLIIDPHLVDLDGKLIDDDEYSPHLVDLDGNLQTLIDNEYSRKNKEHALELQAKLLPSAKLVVI